MPPTPRPELPGVAQALLDAVMAISSDLDQRSVLTRIVEAAAELTGARYAALGVIGPHGSLIEFVTTGLTAQQHERIGNLPEGHGVLGLLIREPHVIRMPRLGGHDESVGFPPNHPPMTTFLGVPVRIRGTVFGNLYLTEKVGGVPFTDQDELLISALASVAGFAVENARAYGLSEQRRQWLEASASLAEALQPPVDVEQALGLITYAARSISGARATALLSYRYDAARTVTADPGDLEVVDAAVDQVVAAPRSGIDITELELETLTALIIPLRAHLAEGAALVVLFDTDVAPHDMEQRELLASFADQAALGLDRAQALADRAELAVISDRERIARDLHDVVIQRLFATGLQLQAASLLAVNPQVVDRLDGAVSDLDQTIRDIRAAIFELEQHRVGSVRADLRAVVREYVPVLGYTVDVRISGPVDTAVPEAVREQLLPVLREALSNLAQHAHATGAEVVLTVTTHNLRLTVLDDGVGPSPDPLESGLRNVRRRAIALGGTLEVSPRSPRGTAFTWWVPLG